MNLLSQSITKWFPVVKASHIMQWLWVTVTEFLSLSKISWFMGTDHMWRTSKDFFHILNTLQVKAQNIFSASMSSCSSSRCQLRMFWISCVSTFMKTTWDYFTLSWHSQFYALTASSTDKCTERPWVCHHHLWLQTSPWRTLKKRHSLANPQALLLVLRVCWHICDLAPFLD